MSIIKVDELSPRSGNDITITSLKTITGLASQFKITGGTAGQALITDGSGGLSFGAVDSLPSQSGQTGKFLKTDGTTATWDSVDEFSVSIAEAAPGSASSGALWWKSDEGRLKIYYNDGSSSQWVDAFPVAEPGATDPAMGGDLTGTASNAQIAANVVGITELNVTDGTSGQALMTNGSGTLNFGNVDALPSQTGQAGEFLQTDGTTATWEPAGGGYDVATTSTGYFDIPSGTIAQRPGSPATGNMRWNTDDEALEHYSGSAGGWVQWAGAAPTITGINPTTSIQAGTNITVNGINFQTGSIIKLIGLDSTVYNAASTTFVSTTEVSFTTPDLPVANEPYDVKLILPAGGFFVLPDALDAGGVPAWTTAAGSLGEISHAATGTHFTLQATEPDGQVITYAETAGVLTGAGLTLNSTTGAITGDPTDVSTSTVQSFDVTATDAGNNVTSRSFSITISNFFAGASGGTIATYSDGGVNYKSHTFTSSSTFDAGIGGAADVLLVAGGGAGSNWHGGGGGAGGMQTFQATATATTYSIVVGNGGAGGTTSRGATGGDSSAFGTTSLGGGIGGNWSTGGGGDGIATVGGSGGGGGATNTGPFNIGAAGTAGQGNAGGDGNGDHWSGGGGGAGADGDDAAGAYYAGDGGIGIINTYRDGTDIYYAGGGGGGTWQGGTSENGDGGLGGGGYGSCNSNSTAPSAGSANTGGGGGGHGGQGNNTSWASQTTGGSGIVVIRYMVS